MELRERVVHRELHGIFLLRFKVALFTLMTVLHVLNQIVLSIAYFVAVGHWAWITSRRNMLIIYVSFEFSFTHKRARITTAVPPTLQGSICPIK